MSLLPVSGLPASRLVLDVSNRNPITRETLAKIAPAALIAKATEGDSFHDQLFAQHRTAARSLGIPFGSYLFLHPSSPGSEAGFYLAYATPRRGDLQPLVDVEATDGEPMNRVAARASSCLSELEAHGFAPLLYCSSSWWRELVAFEPTLRRFRVWEAQYPGRLERWTPAIARLRMRLGSGASVALWQWTDRYAADGRLWDASRLMVPVSSLLIR